MKVKGLEFCLLFFIHAGPGQGATGPNPTSEKIQTALDGLRKFDLGGLKVSYSQTDHSGLDFADLAIISADGKFRR